MSNVLVNPNQKQNPILNHLTRTRFELKDILADFEIGKSFCVLFLSLSYHSLLLVDTSQHQSNLRELNQICAISDLTLILAFSSKDAAKYIEILKTYEFKPADQLRQQTQLGTFSRLTSALTQIKSVNKTDVVTISSNFDSFYKLVHAEDAMLRELPGFGDQKVKRILDAFEEPFLGEYLN